MKGIVKFAGLAVVCSSVLLVACSKEEAPKPSADVAVEAEVVAPEVAEVVAAEVVAEEKPFLEASQELTVEALVTAINQETREVTLKTKDDSELSFVASEEVRNLAQVAVGDMVSIKAVRSLTVEVVDGAGVDTAKGVVEGAVRAEEGEMPGAAASKTAFAIYKVEEINLEANTFKLRDADGVVTEYAARNPENLKRSAVGDAVVVTTTQSIAAEVIKMSAE